MWESVPLDKNVGLEEPSLRLCKELLCFPHIPACCQAPLAEQQHLLQAGSQEPVPEISPGGRGQSLVLCWVLSVPLPLLSPCSFPKEALGRPLLGEGLFFSLPETLTRARSDVVTRGEGNGKKVFAAILSHAQFPAMGLLDKLVGLAVEGRP